MLMLMILHRMHLLAPMITPMLAPMLAHEPLRRHRGAHVRRSVQDVHSVVDEIGAHAVKPSAHMIEIHRGHAIGHEPILLHLRAPAVHELLVSAMRVPFRVRDAGAAELLDEGVVRAGEVEPLVFGVDVLVEPGAVAGLPFLAADHAELGLASARHVVAAVLELDDGFAGVAALPALLFGHFGEFLRRDIVWAGFGRVPFLAAGGTDFGFAFEADAEFAAVVGAPRLVSVDVFGFNPCAAAFSRAVEPIFGGEVAVFAIPFNFEFVIEEFLDAVKGDGFFIAAGGRHESGICSREFEGAAGTVMAHVVFAGCHLDTFAEGDILHASHAFNPVVISRKDGWVRCMLAYCCSGCTFFTGFTAGLTASLTDFEPLAAIGAKMEVKMPEDWSPGLLLL